MRPYATGSKKVPLFCAFSGGRVDKPVSIVAAEDQKRRWWQAAAVARSSRYSYPETARGRWWVGRLRAWQG